MNSSKEDQFIVATEKPADIDIIRNKLQKLCINLEAIMLQVLAPNIGACRVQASYALLVI